MAASGKRSWKTPRDNNLGLDRIENHAGLSISVLPNGCIFAIEHRREGGTTMINQLLGSPVDGGIARLYLRMHGAAPISDPFHRGEELIELLRMRAAQLARQATRHQRRRQAPST